ncbi:MAG: 50S ribosomal protein L9 [Acetobacteraceae bacterium]|nr:50S ribosomal protein L9 [Acetobacteraceae bacterium]
MDVILLQRIEKLGQMGDVVRVKPGYARNFLLPQKKALRATKENRAQFDQQRAELEATNLKRRGEAERVAERAEGLSVVLIRSAGEAGQLYGSVSARDIAAAIGEAGLGVGRQQIVLEKPIKSVGLYAVRVALHPEVVIEVTANVARTPEEAERQARGEVITGAADEAEAASLPLAEDA